MFHSFSAYLIYFLSPARNFSLQYSYIRQKADMPREQVHIYEVCGACVCVCMCVCSADHYGHGRVVLVLYILSRRIAAPNDRANNCASAPRLNDLPYGLLKTTQTWIPNHTPTWTHTCYHWCTQDTLLTWPTFMCYIAKFCFYAFALNIHPVMTWHCTHLYKQALKLFGKRNKNPQRHSFFAPLPSGATFSISPPSHIPIFPPGFMCLSHYSFRSKQTSVLDDLDFEQTG